MESVKTLILCLLFAGIAHLSFGENTPPPTDHPEKIQVMVVGYHYLPHNIMDRSRQEEIRSLAEQLAHFDADKILLHVPFHSLGEERTNNRYRAYLNGTHPLNRSVQEQLGFRLAEYLGHEVLYGIEDHEAMDLSGGLNALESSDQLEGIRELIQNGQTIESAKQAQSNLGSLAEYFAYLNREETLEYEHGMFLKGLSQLRAGEESIGASLLSDWYAYHIRLYANLQQIATDSGQKIIVLLPSRHLPLLQELLEADPSYEWINAAPYLGIQ